MFTRQTPPFIQILPIPKTVCVHWNLNSRLGFNTALFICFWASWLDINNGSETKTLERVMHKVCYIRFQLWKNISAIHNKNKKMPCLLNSKEIWNSLSLHRVQILNRVAIDSDSYPKRSGRSENAIQVTFWSEICPTRSWLGRLGRVGPSQLCIASWLGWLDRVCQVKIESAESRPSWVTLSSCLKGKNADMASDSLPLWKLTRSGSGSLPYLDLKASCCYR